MIIMVNYDTYRILEVSGNKYDANHPLEIGVNQSSVKTTIIVPDIFTAGRYYFRGVNSVISGIVQTDTDRPAYIEANLKDGEIGSGTLTLLSVHGIEANFPYSIKHVPLYETDIDLSKVDTSGLVTKDTFNSTVSRLDADISKGDTDLRLDLEALSGRFTQLSSEVNVELDAFEEALGKIETEVKNLADDVDGFDARITNAENAASSANTVAQAASTAAGKAQTTADEAKAATTQLEAKIGQLETDVESAEVTANTAKTTADEAKTSAEDAVQRAINARLEANKANDGVKSAQTDIDKLKTDVESGLNSLNALDGRLTAAEGNITTLSGKVTAAETSISGLETTTGHLTDNLDQVYSTVNDTVIPKLDEYEPRITQAQTDATQALENASNASEEAAQAQNVADNAITGITSLNAKINNLKVVEEFEGIPVTQTLPENGNAIFHDVPAGKLAFVIEFPVSTQITSISIRAYKNAPNSYASYNINFSAPGRVPDGFVLYMWLDAISREFEYALSNYIDTFPTCLKFSADAVASNDPIRIDFSFIGAAKSGATIKAYPITTSL